MREIGRHVHTILSFVQNSRKWSQYIATLLFWKKDRYVHSVSFLVFISTHSHKWDSDMNNYLDDVLTAWLRKQDDVGKKGVPSWATLATALEDQQLRQNGIVSKIRKERLSQ